MRPSLRLNAAGESVERALHGVRRRKTHHAEGQAGIVSNVRIRRDIAAPRTEKKEAGIGAIPIDHLVRAEIAGGAIAARSSSRRKEGLGCRFRLYELQAVCSCR